MTDTNPLISDVTDTARLVAALRAVETDRPDALFRDPLAHRLSGSKGREMAAGSRTTRDGWWMVARTKLIDDLVLRAIDEGCDRVVNLAAGLDTRPYRLQLPSRLEWIEVDHAGLLEEKQRLLGDQTPRCDLTRRGCDLSDLQARARLLDEVLAEASSAFVLTEGLLMYLDVAQVSKLAADLARPEIAWWTTDVASASLVQSIANREAEALRNAPPKFGPTDGVTYFEDRGWNPLQIESVLAAAKRYRRLPWWMRLVACLPEADPHRPGKKPWYAVVRLAQR